jgi:hypothetical protein
MIEKRWFVAVLAAWLVASAPELGAQAADGTAAACCSRSTRRMPAGAVGTEVFGLQVVSRSHVNVFSPQDVLASRIEMMGVNA